MATRDPAILAQLIGFGIFLWLGLYLLVRVIHRTPLILTAVVALISQAIFFGSSMLAFTAPDVPTMIAYERWFWWTAVVPAAAWFHFSDLIARQTFGVDQRRGASIWTLPVVLCYGVALVLLTLGTATDLLVNYSTPVQISPTREYLERGPAYPAQIAYIALTSAGALLNLVRALRRIGQHDGASNSALAQQLKLLVGGALLFLIGALYIVSRFNWNPLISVLPGYVFLLIGLLGVGYGVANFGLLLEGQDIQRDFFYSFTAISLLNVLYVALLTLTGSLSVLAVLLIVGLVTLTHTMVDAGRNVLDKLFFSRAEQAARAEARDYATSLGTAPVAAPTLMMVDESPVADTNAVGPAIDPPLSEFDDEKAFKGIVRKALTGLKSPPQLARSPLLALKLVEQRVMITDQEDNRLNRTAALREILIEQIDGLRPKDDAATPVSEAWRFFNVLYYPYVRTLSRKSALAEARRLEKERQRQGQREASELEQVLSWLADVDEDTFYKWQRRASDTIAMTLWEENQKLLSPDARVAVSLQHVV